MTEQTRRSQVRARVKYKVQDVLRARNLEVTRFRGGIRSFELRLLTACPPASVIDIGANVGQFAARMRRLEYTGDIWCFEPNPAAFSVLQENAARDDRLHPVAAAAGAAAGRATLNISQNSVSSSLLGMHDVHAAVDPASRYVEATEVDVVALDDWAATARPSKPLWLKVDTQGFEAEVLAGAQRLLQDVDLLRLEISLIPLYEGQPDYVDLLAQVRALGFELAYVEPGFEDRRTHRLLQADACFLSRRAAAALGS